MKKVLIPFLLLAILFAQELAPEVTLEKKKLLILSAQDFGEISQKVTHVVSSAATRLNRYEVIDRNNTERILKEQKFQHSGAVDQQQVVELGQISGANEALLINITNFGQKGVPTKKELEKDEEEEPETGLFGWIVKEAVKATIEKKLEDVERYPNNIQTIIQGDISLVNVETSQSISSFNFYGEHTGGVKAKSLSRALQKVQSQVTRHLKSIYILSSEVLDVRRNEVTLLLGSHMGVAEGTIFEIISPDRKQTLHNREITIPGKRVGFVEVKTTSADANESIILRKWDRIEPGYQAKELTEGIFTGGISGSYGSNPYNICLKLFGQFRPFHRFGAGIHGEIGVVEDSREDMDFQFGFGFSLNYRLFRSSPFSLGTVLNIPFDLHLRNDDKNDEGVSHLVYLPIFSPRLGFLSEIMLSPEIDLVLKAEYILASSNLGNWSYTEKTEDENGESETWAAYWNDGIAPEINYQGWLLSLGIRHISF